MKQTVTLMAPPTAMQPGGYIARAYADHTEALTTRADVEVLETQGVWTITLRWLATQAVIDASDNPRQFVDGAALFAPEVKDAPWISMGTPEMPLEGALWRADAQALSRVQAQGMGTVQRQPAPPDWQAESVYANGHWQVAFTLPGFSSLLKNRQLAFAIWQGAQRERAGLKSVTPGWLSV
jgi:DMSO reductase family type II enzyme heme b subunit